MNDFESRLTTALREEAEEFSMNVDVQRGSEQLADRLDDVEQGRRRWYVVGGAVAVAALIAVAFVLGGRLASPASGGRGVGPAASLSATPTVQAGSFVGEWQTSFTRAQAKSVLEAAGLGAAYGRVMQEFPTTGERLTWKLSVDPSEYRLVLVHADGSTESFDLQSYVLDGRTLTADPTNSSHKRVVFDIGLGSDGASMTMHLLRDDTAPLAPGVPDESIQRVLYTTGTWSRLS